MADPRRLALVSLIKAQEQSNYSNLEINTVLSREKLEKNDAALYTALYLGVLEARLTLDYIISQYSKIAIDELDADALNALRLGIYQLLFMDKIPDYSAVCETVKLCKKRSKGFVNALLRSFIRADKKYTPPSDEWEALSVKTSLPVDVLNILKSSYGEKTARKIAESLRAREGVTLRINTLKISPCELQKTLDLRNIPYSAVDFSDEILIAKAPISELSDLIDGGYVFVQDIASFACVKIFAPQKGERVLDACACPGGKSFSSAIEMKNEGALVSCDLHKNKLSLIKNGAQRLGISVIDVREQDAKNNNPEFTRAFDRVICDVPCSGLGIIPKKPDIKYKPSEQIEGLPRVQLSILECCSEYVKPGGVLVYSTCTLNKAENEDNVRKFLSVHSDFEPCDFELGEIKSVNGMYTFMPHITKTDGFFVAKLKRIK